MATLYLKNSLLEKTIFKTLGINRRELTARNSEARWTFFRFGEEDLEYRGWQGTLEIFLNSERFTSSYTLYMSIFGTKYICF